MDAARRQMRILHLEDSPRDSELIRRQLEISGFDCVITRATGGEEYESALASGTFDIVLCDFNVPGYDALRALERARKTRPDLPFLVISGELSEEQAVDCLRAGATDYLLKHRLQRLVPAVERALEEAVERRRRAEAESARRETEDRFRSVVAAMSEGVVVQDRDGRVVASNAAAARMLGPVETAPGAADLAAFDLDFVREDGSPLPGDEHPAAVTLRTGEPRSQIVVGARLQNGAQRWFSLNTEPLKHAGEDTIHGVVTTITDVTERKRTDQALRRSYSRLKDLSRRRVEVEEEERRNIHRELHDRIGQDLAAIKLNIELIRALAGEELRRVVGTRLDDAQKLAQVTIDNTRNIMAELRPTGLDDFGLVVALRTHAETVARRLGIPVRVSGADPSPRLAAGVETAIYRIAQEALNNVAKHAGARAVEVTLAAHGAQVSLAVVDDGAGFDAARLPADSYGLRVMRERAEAVGARLVVDSTPGRGTRVVVMLEEAHEAQNPYR